MEIEILKLFHWISIVFFLTLSSISLWYGDRSKFLKIFLGISTLLLLLSGLALCWINELAFWGKWPGWLVFKVISWILIGGLVPVIIKRTPKLGKVAYILMMVITICVFYVVLYKEM